MNNNPIAAAQRESVVLARALRDPSVEGLASALGLDLQDPAILNSLIAASHKRLDALSGLGLDQKAIISRALTPMQSPAARAAVRAYRDMALMV